MSNEIPPNVVAKNGNIIEDSGLLSTNEESKQYNCDNIDQLRKSSSLSSSLSSVNDSIITNENGDLIVNQFPNDQFPTILPANQFRSYHNNGGIIGGADFVPSQIDHHHHNPNSHSYELKTYRIRHLLLVIFITISLTNAFQWIEYSIIESIVTEYYQVSTFWVNCTSVVYMVSYIVGIIPATWMLDHYGLRTCLIVGSLGNAVGSWLKCLSISQDRFWVTMIGQTIVAFAQLFVLNIPPVLAATWFPSNEVSRATAYGVFGNQVGIALGFWIPPLLMPVVEDNTTPSNITTTTTFMPHTEFQFESLGINNQTTSSRIESISHGLRILFYGVSLITTFIFLMVLICFKNRPKIPPSHAVAYARTMNAEQSFFRSIKSLLSNGNFMLLLVSYGLNTGVFYAISTVLSQMVLSAIGQEHMQNAGLMGLTITLAGIVGSVICGYILSYYRKRFKMIALLVYLFSLIGTVAFTTGLQIKSVPLLFAISGVLGFFMTGYLPIGFEFAAEISYPQPEGTSAGLLNASAQVFGILFTFISSDLITSYGDIYANGSFIVALAVGTILTCLVRNDLRRQNAHLIQYPTETTQQPVSEEIVPTTKPINIS